MQFQQKYFANIHKNYLLFIALELYSKS